MPAGTDIIMSEKNKKSAIEAAYSYLDARMRTKAEVENKLKEKGYTEDEIIEAVNELIGMRYLDDYQYALRYYEYNREKKRGSARAARELAEKGVDAVTIKNAREDYLYSEKVDEFADALAVAEKELELKSAVCITDEKTAARIARKLDGRGFERGAIFKVLDTLRNRRED